MRRIGRHILNALTAISFLVCLGSAVMWVRSSRVAESISRELPKSILRISTSRCSLWVYSERIYDPGNSADCSWGDANGWTYQRGHDMETWVAFAELNHFMPTFHRPPIRMKVSDIDVRWGSVHLARTDNGSHGWPSITHLVVVPLYSIALLTCLPPLLILVPRVSRWHRRRLRDREGRCLRCGYDVRATPHRCPECGNVPDAQRTELR
jgi:hypothetical protein